MEVFELQLLKKAIDFAEESGKEGNHPCGTVVADKEGNVVVGAGNKVFTTPDITSHAEMLCLRFESRLLMEKNPVNRFTLYSSHEPCCGCAFFIARSNINKIVYAAKDRYRPGLGMLKSDNKFTEYFKDIQITEEPDLELRNRALNLMKDYFISKDRLDTAKFFDPDNL